MKKIAVIGLGSFGMNLVKELAKKIAEITGGKIHMVIGGYHSPSKKVLDNLAAISDLICPAHCSGEIAKEYVRKKYPSKYYSVRTGSVIKLP